MTLKKGDHGPAVKKHQEGIKAWNSKALPEHGADKDFGPETETWVKRFQNAAGIPQTGEIDGVTSALILRFNPVIPAGTGKHSHKATVTVGPIAKPKVTVEIGDPTS